MRFQNQTAPVPAGLLNGGSQTGNGDPPPHVLVDLLVKEVAALVSDPTFAVETDTISEPANDPVTGGGDVLPHRRGSDAQAEHAPATSHPVPAPSGSTVTKRIIESYRTPPLGR